MSENKVENSKPANKSFADAFSVMADQVMESPGFQSDELIPVSPPPPAAKETPETAESPREEEKKEGVTPEKQTPSVDESEKDLPEDLKTPKDLVGNVDAEKRIRGFQSAFTKRMQSLEQEISDKLSKDYEKRFQEVLAKLPTPVAQQSNAPALPQGESLSDFFPGVPKEQIEPLDRAIKTMIERQTAPLKTENQQLKSYMNQAQANQEIQNQYVDAKKDFPEIDTRMQDLVAWSQINPALAKGKSVKEMYMLMTYAEQFNRGKETALSELKKKEKESVEVDSVPNTVSNKKAKTLAEAAQLAWEQMAAKRK